ncbi:MAG: DUF507 family protein [Nitrospirota bacterium]|nr:DUF507 family protein [Nitrospirota bacterium]
MALLLSDEKQMHLSHVILGSLKNMEHASLVGDEAQALREIKKVIAEHMKVEAELEQKVRRRLESYSRPVPEGSQEWDVLYQKTFEEELRKRKLE